MPGPVTYWNTLRYLKPVQVYGRLRLNLKRPLIENRPPPPLRNVHHDLWVRPAGRRPSLLGAERLSFLNQTHELNACGWDDPAIDKLWRYNLHYFDDLNAYNAAERQQWQQQLLSRWVKDNRPGEGTGWDPYPTSLRIVNWIKCALGGHPLSVECAESLAVQARWLIRRLETHLLGNHLFVNAKALIFAGAFFRGGEADVWLSEGLRILRHEVEEQILADGGHFERSPMYHSLILEDLLDLINLSRVCPHMSDAPSWCHTAHDMRTWLWAMCHPEGEISFFNDAAFGVAPKPAELEAYAARLGLPPLNVPEDGVTHLAESGYIRLQSDAAVALLDVSPVGPDYIPGHAHADTLSFELSLFGQRVFVNSGTSCYGEGVERLRQRGTAAHHTVELDGRNSTEVWGGFRVARRARPFGLAIEKGNTSVRIRCAHNGYVRLLRKQIHWREWTMSDTELCVDDHITGPFEGAVARLHLAPDAKVCIEHAKSGKTGHIELAGGQSLNWSVEGATPSIESSTYHSEFGVAQPNACLKMVFTAPRSTVRLSWK